MTNDVWKCAIDGCTKGKGKSRRGAVCEMHYQRMHRHGSYDKPVKRMPKLGEHPKWTGEAASYNAAHQRMRAKFGSASGWKCECGEPAAHWAYDHLDPNERQSDYGPYSVNPDHYHPMCVVCHKAFDLTHLPANAPWHKRRSAHCGRGHALHGSNLIPSSLAKGQRHCLTCNRTWSHCRKRGLPFDTAIADSYYAEIMKNDVHAA